MQWLTPEFQHFARLSPADHLKSGDGDQPGQHDETPSLLQIQKLAGHGGASVIPATLEAEAGESLESWETEVTGS